MSRLQYLLLVSTTLFSAELLSNLVFSHMNQALNWIIH